MVDYKKILVVRHGLTPLLFEATAERTSYQTRAYDANAVLGLVP